jgi:hypothetical protein
MLLESNILEDMGKVYMGRYQSGKLINNGVLFGSKKGKNKG